MRYWAGGDHLHEGIHFCPADLAVYSGFVRCHFALLKNPTAISIIPVGNGIAQQLLDQLVEAIYSRTIELNMQNVEMVLRAAHYLKSCTAYCVNNIATVGGQASFPRMSLHSCMQLFQCQIRCLLVPLYFRMPHFGCSQISE